MQQDIEAGTPNKAPDWRRINEHVFTLATADGRYNVIVWLTVAGTSWRWRVGDTTTGRNARGADLNRDFAMSMAVDRLRDFRRFETLDLPFPGGREVA